MKKSIITRVLPAILVLAVFMNSTLAVNTDLTAFAGSYQSTDVPIDSSNQVTEVGEV